MNLTSFRIKYIQVKLQILKEHGFSIFKFPCIIKLNKCVGSRVELEELEALMLKKYIKLWRSFGFYSEILYLTI